MNIRTIRKARGLTLGDLADKIGVSIPHLSEIERGKKNLNNHILVRLADALNVEPSELISDEKHYGANDLMIALRELNDEDVQRVRSFVEALLLAKKDNG